MARVCDADGCDRAHHAQGFCAMHYLRWYRHGDATVTRSREHAARLATRTKAEHQRAYDLAVLRWYLERLDADPYYFLRGEEARDGS